MFPAPRPNNESEHDYSKRMEEHDRIWNAAIEAAAKICDKYDSYGAAYEIRKTLKK